jgi:hypothetical protein
MVTCSYTIHYPLTCLSFCLQIPLLPQVINLLENSSSSSTRETKVPWGPEHPLWTFHNQVANIPHGYPRPGDDPSPEVSPLPSDNDNSSYEDSDSKRRRRNQELRERYAYNMSRPNNETYVAIKEDQKKKKADRKRKLQEEKPSLQRPYHRGGRGGGRRGERGHGSNRSANTPTSLLPRL